MDGTIRLAATRAQLQSNKGSAAPFVLTTAGLQSLGSRT